MSKAALEILDRIHALPEPEQRFVFVELSREFDETAYLFASQANAAEIEKGLAEYGLGRLEEHELRES
jgi:hypothetical protein